MSLRFCVLLLSLIAITCDSARTQVTTGTILGTVTDTSGAAIADAEVTVTEITKGTTQQFKTDEAGSYNATFLVPGSYRVTVEKSGFKRAVAADSQVDVDQKVRIDVSLQVGGVNETVEVTAAAPLVRSETAELGEVISERAVQQLPLNGRNFAQLVYLAPGVTTGQAGENLSGSSTFNPRAGSNFNALGSQANANAWLVDGIMDNEYTFNTVMVQPSVESVQEFKILTGTYSAEFGRGAGVVTTQTRSGSNEFHGSLFEFLRNSYMDARNYFNSAGVQKQPPYRRNQFGAAVGGPIWKNKTFFFADYYGWREVKGQTFINTVPTAQEHAGNFSDLLPLTIYNPFTTRTVNGKVVRDPFAGNVIPANLINQVGANVASLYPLPNLAGLSNNRVDTLSRNLDDNGGNIRIDHRFSEKDSMFGRYSFEQFNLFDTKGQGGCCIPTPAGLSSKFDLGPFIAGGQNTVLAASGFAFNETHVFSPTVVNELIAGFARTNPFTTQSDYGHNAATSLGIQGINLSQFTTGIPTINITGIPGNPNYTSLNGGPSFLPAHPRQTSYQIQDSVSLTLGSHSLKVGYRIIRNDVSPFTNTNTRGALNFGLNLTNDPVTGNGGNGYASLLLGLMANGNSADATRGFLQSPYYLRAWEHAAFVEDDWKVSRRLTLNLGLRWDIFPAYTEQNNRLTNFNLSTLSLVYAGVNGVSKSAGVQTRWNDFGPHFGFAYDATGNGKTVLRGGYSMSYFPEQPSASNMLGQAVPWAISQNTPTVPQYPLDTSVVPSLSSPFGSPTPIQPTTTAQLISANPSILGQSFANQTPYYESWNFDVEHQITGTMMAEVAYAGSRGVHLLYCYNPQEVEPGTTPAAQRVTIPAIANLRSILQCDERNMSNYHGLQAKLTKSFSGGLQFLASYTWSKSLDYGGSAASGGGGVGNPQTITNLKAGYGPSGFDVPQRFVGSLNWELPFGKGKHYLQSGLLSYIAGGWQLGGIGTIQSGLPFTVSLSSCNQIGSPSACWPDRVASGSVANQSYSHWYDPGAFEAPCLVASVNEQCPNSQYAYRYGNAGRGILRGPGTFNFDLSAVKAFSVKERLKFELRLDAFNALNHPQMGFPNQSVSPSNPVGSSTAITSTVGDNRDMQAALRVVF